MTTERSELILRGAVASIWFLTGILVVHPFYREIGESWLAPLGLPWWVMVVCLADVISFSLT